VGVLVVLSLVLITTYFREADGGRLHGAQGAAASVLRPFEVGAERVARPFRDAYGYFTGLFHAKSEAARLRREVEVLRQRAVQASLYAQQNQNLRQAAHYIGSPLFPRGYRPLTTSIVAQPSTAWDQTVVVNAGANSGVKRGDAVVTTAGLVGIVTLVYSDEAKVALLTDESSPASAADQRTGARGIVKHTGGANGSFSLQLVPVSERVRAGDRVVTAGWRQGKLTPLYPAGLKIGVVTNVSQRDTDPYKSIQVSPYVDFGRLDTVIVLLKRPSAR
jgi:rod shape-determining protein MreC